MMTLLIVLGVLMVTSVIANVIISNNVQNKLKSLEDFICETNHKIDNEILQKVRTDKKYADIMLEIDRTQQNIVGSLNTINEEIKDIESFMVAMTDELKNLKAKSTTKKTKKETNSNN